MFTRRTSCGRYVVVFQLRGELLQVAGQPFREVLDRHMIDARRAPVGRHFRVRRKQVRRGVHLVDQAEPNSSFHSLFQSRQHAVCPNRRFGPRPAGANFSGLLSRCRHCRRVGFRRFVHSASISLRPFARRALPRFLAPTDALTPERPVLRVLIRDNERRTCLRSGLLASCIKPSDRSASNHLLPPPGLVWFCPGAYRAVARPHPFRGP